MFILDGTNQFVAVHVVEFLCLIIFKILQMNALLRMLRLWNSMLTRK